jgi:adenosylhomocysteine nucleosidase
MSEILVVAAMKEEIQGLLENEGADVVYVGIGKVNAASILARELALRSKNSVRLVVNFGTAGSTKFATHSIVECTKFAQRDMDLSALGFAPGVTPFETDPPVLEVEKRLLDLPTGICGTGDRFETETPKVECDVVDMEAYALAKVALREGVSFLSVKYITDGSDANAHNDWAANLPRAAEAFRKIYLRLKS